ncbi:hypothetical protein VDGL01_08805 [Verticillium dahliae]
MKPAGRPVDDAWRDAGEMMQAREVDEVLGRPVVPRLIRSLDRERLDPIDPSAGTKSSHKTRGRCTRALAIRYDSLRRSFPDQNPQLPNRATEHHQRAEPALPVRVHGMCLAEPEPEPALAMAMALALALALALASAPAPEPEPLACLMSYQLQYSNSRRLDVIVFLPVHRPPTPAPGRLFITVKRKGQLQPSRRGRPTGLHAVQHGLLSAK